MRALRYSVLLYLYLPWVPIRRSRWYVLNSPSLITGLPRVLAASYIPFRLMQACRHKTTPVNKLAAKKSSSSQRTDALLGWHVLRSGPFFFSYESEAAARSFRQEKSPWQLLTVSERTSFVLEGWRGPKAATHMLWEG